MVHKYVTDHAVLFIEENCLENRANQKNQRVPKKKSLQQANLTRES